MKKKLFQFLMLLVVAITTGIVVSCKDTNEDLYEELRLQGISDKAALEAALETQRQNFQSQLDAYQDLLDQINSCACDNEALKEELKADYEAKLAAAKLELQNAINGKVDPATVTALQTKVTDLESKIAALDARVTALEAANAALETALANKADAATVTALEGKVAALEAEIRALQGEDAALNVAISTLNTTIAQMQEKINNINNDGGYIEDESGNIVSVVDKTKELIAKINALETAMVEYKTQVEAAIALIQQAVTDNTNAIANNAANIATNAAAIAANAATIQAGIDAINGINLQLVSMSDSLKVAYETAAAAKAQAEANELLISELTARVVVNEINIATNTADIAALKDQIADLTAEAASLRAYADDILQKAKAYTDLEVSLLKVQLKDYTDAKVADLTAALEMNQQTIYDELDMVWNELFNYGNQIRQNYRDIWQIKYQLDEIYARLDNIDAALASKVSGIIVQGTYNPIFGSFSMPTGMQTNILMGFYGKAENAHIYFPTQGTTNYIDASQALTAEDMEMIGGEASEPIVEQGGVITHSGDGSKIDAGSLYVTINPSSVNFVGLPLALQNSQAVASKVQLEPLAETDKTLTFGWTRAQGNGFYEAKAYINAADLNEDEDAINLNKDMIKEVAKEIFNNGTGADFATIASNMMGAIESFSMDAQAAKATWTDYQGEHSVYSNYNLAATAIKPLNFSTADELENKLEGAVTNLNGKMWSLLDKIYGTVKNNPVWDKIAEFQGSLTTTFPQNVTLNHIEVNGTHIAVNMEYEGLWSLKPEYEGLLASNPYTVYFKVTFTPEQAALLGQTEMLIPVSQKELVTLLMYQGAQTEEIINSLGTVLGSLNTFLGSIEEMKNILPEETINGYVTKLQNLLLKGVNHIGTFMRPLMVAAGENAYVSLSQAASLPTLVKGSTLTLKPTSWNGELVVPIARKHVAVTNVSKGAVSAQGGDATCKSVLTAANSGNLNTVLDGSEREVVLNLTSGYTYTIAYSALDYAGQIVTYKYYVTAQ